jgi:hypothetical protein
LWFKDTKAFKLIRHFGAWRVAEQNLLLTTCTSIRPHPTLVGRPNLLNKYVALSVCVRCRSLRKSQTSDDVALPRSEHPRKGVEAMELTVDGKPAPTTVVYTASYCDNSPHALALQVVALGPNAASTITIRSAFRASFRALSPSGAPTKCRGVCDRSATTRSRPPPLSRITDRKRYDGSKFGTAACQYVSEDRRLNIRASLV